VNSACAYLYNMAVTTLVCSTAVGLHCCDQRVHFCETSCLSGCHTAKQTLLCLALRQQSPLQHCYPPTKLHCTTFQKTIMGCALARVVSCPCGISGGQTGIGTGFCQNNFYFPVSMISPLLHLIGLSPMQHNLCNCWHH
jgi:hypothetical protein